MDPEPLFDVMAVVSPAILQTSAKVGAASGVLGLCLGGVIGTVRGTTPALFAVASGVQCSAIGASWCATKSFADVYQVRRNGTDASGLTDGQKILSHTAAGALTGGLIGAVFRGRSNVLPGIAVLGIFGFSGSALFNRLINKERVVDQNPKPGLGHRILHSRFSPMKVLSDDEYADMLEEKLIRIEAEIALIDEGIEKVKAEKSIPSIDLQE